MVKYAQYIIMLATLSLFMVGCGFKYERFPSVSYRILITTDDHQKASSTLQQAFKDVGLELVPSSKFSGYESFAIYDKSSRIIVILYYDPPHYKRANINISISPSRFVAYSKTRENEHEKRKQSLLRIKNILEKN